MDSSRAPSSRRQRLARSPSAQRLARDDDLLHLGRALVDAQRADLAVKLLDLLALGGAPAAVQLDSAVDHALGSFRGEHLGHCGFARDARRASVLSPRGAI